MTRLVLVRHGRTSWNAQGRYQGHCDIELDEVGRAQAKAVSGVIAEMGPASLWSSDLSRAAQTAEAISQACGLAVRPEPRLRERFCGPFESLTPDEIRATHPEAADEFFAGGGPLGAESLDDVAKRVQAALVEIADAQGKRGTTVVVSHGWAIRIAVNALIGAQAASMRGLENCGWAELTRDGDAWHLLAWNRVARH